MRDLVSRQLRRLRRLVFPRLRAPDFVPIEAREPALDALYRLVLGRPIDAGGREHYLRLMRDDGVTLREIAAELAVSDGLQERLMRRGERRFFEPPIEKPDGFVDVRDLLATRTLAELSDTAEQYYRKSRDHAEQYHAKPLANIHDAPDLLAAFAHLLDGVRATAGMRVLDFGAGTGWVTRFLTQLGCDVVATDVSPTALALAEELFTRLPPVGNWTPPRFIVFDGRHIDLPAESVDRIVCFDAFHHVPNPAEVLVELARVLRPGGIAGFSEPGPNHSKSAQSQFEMKNYVVVENDVVLSDIRRMAEAAGFTHFEVGIFSTHTRLLPLEAFDDLMAGGPEIDAYGDHVRQYLSGHQTFFLHKGVVEMDSRDKSGLKATLSVQLSASEGREGEGIRGRAVVTNAGQARWLPSGPALGGVSLGVHLKGSDGSPLRLDFARFPLAGETRPGDSQAVEFEFPRLDAGDYLLEFDLVSEGVAWFEAAGSQTARISLTVGARRV